MNDSGKRYIGLDVHKHYLIALGVDKDLQVVLPAWRVELTHLEAWMKKTLTREDAVVLEMTTNTWQLYDELAGHAGSVTVVHPPQVRCERQDRSLHSGTFVSQRFAGRDLGTATGSA